MKTVEKDSQQEADPVEALGAFGAEKTGPNNKGMDRLRGYVAMFAYGLLGEKPSPQERFELRQHNREHARSMRERGIR